MRPTRLLVAATSLVMLLGALVLWASLARFNPFGSDWPFDVRAEAEVQLTQAQPMMAVEFVGSFETEYSTGIGAQLYQIRPAGSDETESLATFSREYWDGDSWITLGPPPEITRSGVNTFRFRWILELAEGNSLATIPIEVRLNPVWPGGSDMPPPDETEVQDVRISVVDIYPVSSR